jgi:hypothetical protein
MTWGNVSNISTANLDSATDSPAAAREDLLAALGELQNVINGLGTTEGAVKLEADGKIFANEGIKTGTSKNLNLQPITSMVKITSFINLAPVAYASLPSSPANGDVAFLTTDGAAATKNKPIYHNGTDWKYFNDDSTVASS